MGKCCVVARHSPLCFVALLCKPGFSLVRHCNKGLPPSQQVPNRGNKMKKKRIMKIKEGREGQKKREREFCSVSLGFFLQIFLKRFFCVDKILIINNGITSINIALV